MCDEVGKVRRQWEVDCVDISIKMAALQQNFDLNIEILRVLHEQHTVQHKQHTVQHEQHTVQHGLCAKTHHL